jgi:hypothetical protein
MELFVLLLIAGVGGYLLANSRFGKRIDDTGERVAGVTRDAADRAENGVRRIFRRKPVNSEAEVIDTTASDVPPAEKQPSRRKESGE